MDSHVFFTKLRAVSILDQIAIAHEALCIYTEKSPLFSDEIFDVPMQFVDFADYGAESDFVLQDNSEIALVVLGISDMIRPSNRCDIRFEYMDNFAKHSAKFVIDHVPFLQEKWRVWYPYGVLDPRILLYPHSYAIESAWRAYEEGRTDEDPLPLAWIVEQIAPHTSIDYDRFFEFELQFHIHETSAAEKRAYERLKANLFSEETTVRPIIRALWQYARSVYPEHSLPLYPKALYDVDLGPLFNTQTFNMTDLKVDQYLRGEIQRLYDDTNDLVRMLYEEEV